MPELIEPDQVIEELLALPMLSVDELHDHAPAKPGFYAWWCGEGVLPVDVPAPPHPLDNYRLLYVGVAPNGAESASDLRKRLRQHRSANLGSSTFRFSLAALLWRPEAWGLTWTDRPTLTNRARAELDRWQREHLRVRWCEINEPWAIEAAVIKAMHPPMNREHNKGHPFYTSMGVARNEMRRAARGLAKG